MGLLEYELRSVRFGYVMFLCSVFPVIRMSEKEHKWERIYWKNRR
jgi:hypothetical protein